MYYLINNLENISTLFIAIALLVAAVECFFGFKIFKVQIAVIGFAGGFALAATICGFFALEQNIVLISAFVTAALFAFLAYKLYLLGIFLNTFLMTAGIAGVVFYILNNDIGMAVVVASIAGLIFAVISVLMAKPMIILSTALAGAFAMGIQLTALLSKAGIVYINLNSAAIKGYEQQISEYMVTGVLTAIFFVLGVVIQFVTNRKKVKVVTETVIEKEIITETVTETASETVTEAVPVAVAVEAVAEEPVVEEPIVEKPIVEEPVAEEPVAEEPVAEEPVAEEPVAEEPVVEEPIAEEPIVEEPVVEEPVVEEPVVEEPVVEAVPAVLFCGNCGKKLPETAKFCSGCGSKV